MSMKRQARELALQMLFPYEFQTAHQQQAVSSLPFALSNFINWNHLSSDIIDYAQKLVEGIIFYQAQIDKLIFTHTKSWSLERMVSVDKIILRIGTYEIKYLHTDPSVVINETIEVAKKYSTLDSGCFINGVLDSIQRDATVYHHENSSPSVENNTDQTNQTDKG